MFLPCPTRSLLGFFFLVWPLLTVEATETEWSTTPAGLYKKYCSVCHGKGGDGKSAAAQGMTPPPRDFTAPEVMVELTQECLFHSVSEGRPGTAMVAWKGLLTPSDIAGVVDYILNTLMPAARTQGASPGRSLFAKKCSVCHGDRGDVAVWARGGLTPPPRDFTTDNARWELTRERMIFAISYGRPETAMPSWLGRLTAQEIESVVNYIRTAFMTPKGAEQTTLTNHDQVGTGPYEPGKLIKHEQEHEHSHSGVTAMRLPIPNGLVGDVAWGRRFYGQQCATCHGEKGDGKGPRADLVYPKPRDFFHPAVQQTLNRPHLFDVIAKGTPGSEMPAWDKVLTEQEIANVVEYLFQAFIRPPTAPVPTPTDDQQTKLPTEKQDLP